MIEPNRSRRRRRAHATSLLLAAVLAGCANNAYYLRSDTAISFPAELSALDLSLLADHPLEVAATFKSDGVVQPQDSRALYDSITAGLESRGIHQVHRYAPLGGDVGLDIAVALEPPVPKVTKAAVPAADEDLPAAAAPPPAPLLAPRLLVLVENHPDLSLGTRTRYFFSGLSMGTWSPNQSTDRYDVTIVYRDPQGLAHRYRSHQELVLSTGTTVFDRDNQGVAGLHRYSDPMAAFGGVVANAINGPGVVKVGKPQSSRPAGAAAP